MPMRVVRFIHRATRPHRQAIAIGLMVLAAAFLGSFAIIQNASERADQTAQFCKAIPNAAAASAQALVDVLVADAEHRGVPYAQIQRTRDLGRIYVRRARFRALGYLPSCPQEAP